jgi:hypothetical protein
MPTTWTIAIDWDRNNNYTGTYDDVTNRVISAKCVRIQSNDGTTRTHWRGG